MSERIARAAFAGAIFLAGFLVFLVQPMIGKAILPWFGGAASVWTMCLLFFQTALLGGYAYAHLLALRLPHGWLVRVHLLLLGLSVLLLPVTPMKPGGAATPVTQVVFVLAAAVGLQYLLLASTGPLLQALYARAFGGDLPYRFYALSNVASLAGLLAYPIVIEPTLPVRGQQIAWSAAYVAYVVLCAVALLVRGRQVAAPLTAETESKSWTVWLVAPALASALLVSGTAFLSESIAPTPLVWVVPLAAYLASFAIVFSGWNPLAWTTRLAVVGLAAMALLIRMPKLAFEAPAALGLTTLGVLLVSIYCHGEVLRRRPGAAHLTHFYLAIAAGGAIGGSLAALGPAVLPVPLEFPIAVAGCAALLAVLEWHGGVRMRLVTSGMFVATLVAGLYSAASWLGEGAQPVARNLYGTLRLQEEGLGTAQVVSLVHGPINHGSQITNEGLEHVPTTYYAMGTGVQLAIEATRRPGQRVGVIGLGVGTLAAYADTGDVYRFYELNPAVVEVARSRFSVLSNSEARVEVVVGDARLSMEREGPQSYDVLVVDAFSGDSVPAHLLTREALGVYLRHLRPGGVLAFHVSNKVFDLEPVVAGVARDSGVAGVMVESAKEPALYRLSCKWVLLSRDPAVLNAPPIGKYARPLRVRADLPTWTDDYTSLWPLLE